jgi:hypothetical protein
MDRRRRGCSGKKESKRHKKGAKNEWMHRGLQQLPIHAEGRERDGGWQGMGTRSQYKQQQHAISTDEISPQLHKETAHYMDCGINVSLPVRPVSRTGEDDAGWGLGWGVRAA